MAVGVNRRFRSVLPFMPQPGFAPMTQPNTAPVGARETRRFVGKTFAVAGKLKSWEKERLLRLIQLEGGQLVEAVSAALDYLILLDWPRKRVETTRKQAEAFNQQGASIQLLDF